MVLNIIQGVGCSVIDIANTSDSADSTIDLYSNLS